MNQLYDYQEKGVDHLLSMPFGKPHALLADDPGTGKTMMAIEAAKRSGCKNGIIICPAIIKEQWRRQMINWQLCPQDEIQVLYGLNAQVDNRPWVVLNYDLAREEQIRKQLAARKWHVLTLDEVHRLKTHNSKQTKSVFHKDYGIGNSCYYKFALSGTIMPNRPAELYPMLKTMCPEAIKPYDTWDAYKDHFCGGAYMAGKGASHIPELTERIQPFFLRRALRDVWRDCPALHENIVWLDVPFSEHPEWIGSDFLYESTERRIVAEAKVSQTVAYLKDRLESGVDKIACFTFHRKVLEGISTALQQFNPLKIYGGVSDKKREESLAKFQQDPSARLFLLQISSGGEGVDGLQNTCAEYVLSEPEWTPGREDQAGARILRIGQTRPVIETRLYASGSYEETIYYANLRKRKVINVVTKPNGGIFTMSLESDIKSMADSLKKIAEVLTTPQASFAPPSPNGQPAPGVAAAPLQLVPAAVPAAIAATAGTPMIPSAVPNQQLAQLVAAPIQVAAPSPAIAAAPASGTPIAAPAGISRADFEKRVTEVFKSYGDAGMPMLQAQVAQFGKGRVGELEEANFQIFLNMMPPLNPAIAS